MSLVKKMEVNNLRYLTTGDWAFDLFFFIKNKCNIIYSVWWMRLSPTVSFIFYPGMFHCAGTIFKHNKDIQDKRLHERLSHVPVPTNLCWLMPCAFVSFVTVVGRQPSDDLYPHSPDFRSLLSQVGRACWGSSLRGKQNICAGQAGSAGQSKSAEQCEEGQNLPWRALFNQKEVTVSNLAKRILNPAPVQFLLPSSRRKPL